jgi:hypothetical protein
MTLLLGLISLLASAVYDSYVAAFVGLGLTFWGVLLFLIMPTTYVKLELLTAASSSLVADLEEMLNITALSGKGIYLPPKLLRDHQLVLLFLPATGNEALPKREEIPEGKGAKTSKGLFLTPPGLALSNLLEKKLGKSFTGLNLDKLTSELPKLFGEMEITKTCVIHIGGNNVTVEAKNHIFQGLCLETKKLERTHEAVGCPFSSAIACVLAEVTGKPVILEKEEQNQDGKTTTIQYRLLEE